MLVFHNMPQLKFTDNPTETHTNEISKLPSSLSNFMR